MRRMMRSRYFWLSAAAGLSAWAVLSGCGMSRMQVGSEAGRLSSGAGTLKLQVLPAGEDPAFPSVAQTDTELGKASENVLVNDNEINFRDVIQLPDLRPTAKVKGKPIFFVFPESAFGSPIREAFYTHRIKSSLNQESGEPDRLNASFDQQTRRWFISLRQMLQERDVNVDESQEQELRLECLLADHSRLEIWVRFRARGPMPMVQVSAPAQPALGDAHNIAFNGARSGLIIRREEYYNPTPRRLKLWLKANPADFRVRPQAGYSLTAWGVFTGWQYIRNEGWFSMNNLRITRSSGALEDHRLDQADWVETLIGPYERFTADWTASAKPGSQFCPLAGRVLQVEVVGNYGHQARVAPEWLSKEIATNPDAPSEAIDFYKYAAFFSVVAGDTNNRPAAFGDSACRGLF